MIKRNIAILASCAMLATLAGCGLNQNNNETQNQSETSVSENTTTEVASETSSESDLTQIIKPGDVWIVHDKEDGDDHSNDHFIIFNDEEKDENSGGTRSFYSGTGLPFVYDNLRQEGDKLKVSFHMGDVDTIDEAEITVIDDEHWSVYTKKNPDSIKEEMNEEYTFFKNIGSDEFDFYSGMDLEKWFTQYYESENGESHGKFIMISEPNGVDITIKVPKSKDDETVVATYKVDRFTSQLSEEGKDLEKEVFLNQFDDSSNSDLSEKSEDNN